MLELLETYRPTAAYGFPSSVATLAEALDGRYRFRNVLVGSDMLPSQIQAAEQMVDKVIASYGLSEGAAFALRCPSCGSYEELCGHGLTTMRQRSDGLREIIGTGF